MQGTFGQARRGVASGGGRLGQAVARWRRREIPTPLAIAVYFAGAMVETLGLALVAAYGWILVGVVIAVAGFALGTAGNRRWPSSGESVWMNYFKRARSGAGLALAFAFAVLMVALPVTSASAAVFGRPVDVLGGFTSQGWPVVAEVTTDRKLLEVSATGVHMSCTSGGSFNTEDVWGPLSIGARGAIHGRISVPPQAGSTVTLTGGSNTFTGKLNRARLTLTGVWHLHLNFRTADGQTDQCDSGRVTFRASR
jgi:hypothetical protein